MLDRGICVSLGSDGAVCNNHLDMFGGDAAGSPAAVSALEPGALPARQALTVATRNGARAWPRSRDRIHRGRQAG